MTKNAPKFKPCPFCGGTKVHFYPLHRMATHRSHPFVLCHGCSARVNGEEDDYSLGADTAVDAWNTRALITKKPHD